MKIHTFWGRMANLKFLSRFKLVPLMAKNSSYKPHKVRNCPHNDQHKIVACVSSVPIKYVNIHNHENTHLMGTYVLNG